MKAGSRSTEQQECLSNLWSTCVPVQAIVNNALAKVKVHLCSSSKIVGDRSKGLPLWSLRLTKDSPWPDVKKEAERTLLRKDYIEKVKELQKDLKEDLRCDLLF